MREIRDVRIPFAELRGRLRVSHDDKLFTFVLRRLGVKDIKIEADAIVVPSFIPIEPLLAEGFAALERDGVKPAPCARCAEIHDVEHDPGIFKNPVRFEGFICKSCAQKLSAWEYCDQLLEL